MNKKLRLRPKYIVKRLSQGEIEAVHAYNSICDRVSETGKATISVYPDDVDSPFVLMPRKDPAAFAAMITYCQVCEADLAQEIAEWLTKIAQANPVFGTQGSRNYESVRMQAVRDIIVGR